MTLIDALLPGDQESPAEPLTPDVNDIPVIQIGDRRFFLPYAHLFPPLSNAEYDELRESIGAHGIQQPVVVARRDGAGGFDVIDGAHRLKVAAELGLIHVPLNILGERTTPAERTALAWTLNTARRHLSAETRQQLALRLRGEGKSYRQIGEALGVGKTTVQRDLGTSGVPLGTPATVTGRDGKTYAAVEPEPTESEVAIARDWVAEALSSWSRPANRGSIYNEVRRLAGAVPPRAQSGVCGSRQDDRRRECPRP